MWQSAGKVVFGMVMAALGGMVVVLQGDMEARNTVAVDLVVLVVGVGERVLLAAEVVPEVLVVVVVVAALWESEVLVAAVAAMAAKVPVMLAVAAEQDLVVPFSFKMEIALLLIVPLSIILQMEAIGREPAPDMEQQEASSTIQEPSQF